MSLSGSRAVIAGGTSGIGLAAAKAFIDGGASIVIAGRSAEKLEAALGPLGPRASGQILDAGDDAQVKQVFGAWGGFDHLVVSLAGGAALGPFRQLSDAAFKASFDTKFWSYLSVIRHAIPHLSAHGSITVVTGASAKKAGIGVSTLAAANGAMETIVPHLALELAPIRVNAVSPGVVDTPAWERIPADKRGAMFDEVSAATPLRRVGQSPEIAAAIVSLAGNGFITGVILRCDGGMGIG
jgi:NAD(P)-dependent dehydrogenase (short-subunit alcohol dehydrogenase family)